MILKGAQRGGAKALAVHLLNDNDNDHVELHEMSGFLSNDVTGAFKEIQAIAKGTRCHQPFFSVSLNPPADASVPVDAFETAVDRIAEANGLTGQPRVIIFHEKEGRRHAHVVFSRIDAATMTAKNLPHFKNRLQTISRNLFFEHQWKMPPGLRDRRHANPTNVTLAEWQSAKRRGKNAIDQKKLIQQCWASSDSRAGFLAALNDYGYILAKGDRRGHVIVCHDGEILAVSRATGLKAKAVRERLGEPDDLPTVQQAMTCHAQDIRGQFGQMAGEARQELTVARDQLDNQRTQMIAQHRTERELLNNGQTAQWSEESHNRMARFKTGLAGIWQRFSGQRAKVQTQNAAETYDALLRDRAQRQRLADAQLNDRRELEISRTKHRQFAFGLIKEMRSERDEIIARLTEPRPIKSKRRVVPKQQDRDLSLEP